MFEQEYRNRINQVIKAIIRHPAGPSAGLAGDDWTTQALAELAGISTFHFHRIFRALTGETMFAFLQRRRLLRSIEMMNEDRFTLTEIALECGFDSSSSLSRAFRKHFGCSPTQFRKQHPPLMLPPSRPRPSSKNSIQIEIRETPARQALIVERKGLIDQSFSLAAAAAFRVLVAEIKRVNGWPAMRESFGMCPDEASMVPDAEARYQAGFFYEGRVPKMSDEVQRLTIPGGKWAVSIHQGSYDTLWQSWNRLYRDLLPASGSIARHAAPFEIYLNNKKTVSPEELRTEIWIPIE
ncbi:MAG: AraC family transcriptional regulator [Acidobacteria bacterium]|nr:AraC family transcriptional regulator [Acidobacteriota bacterium]